MKSHRAVATRIVPKVLFFFCLLLSATSGAFVVSVSSVSAAPPPFLTNYQLYDRSEDIRSLQQFFNMQGDIVAESGPGSPGQETTIFGLHTFQALKNFQSTYGLPATGFFGPLTRTFINSAASTSISSSTLPVSHPPATSSAATTTSASTSSPQTIAPSFFGTPLPGYAPGRSFL
jgi:peptidoglycan hydrolase-like protein with peptidoglycan-binding domain